VPTNIEKGAELAILAPNHEQFAGAYAPRQEIAPAWRFHSHAPHTASTGRIYPSARPHRCPITIGLGPDGKNPVFAVVNDPLVGECMCGSHVHFSKLLKNKAEMALTEVVLIQLNYSFGNTETVTLPQEPVSTLSDILSDFPAT
jgi:hypothetical protein